MATALAFYLTYANIVLSYSSWFSICLPVANTWQILKSIVEFV